MEEEDRLLAMASAALNEAEIGNDARLVLLVAECAQDEKRVLELLELQHSEGPCYEAFVTGDPVVVPHLSDRAAAWPTFVPAATERGVVAAYALPLRLRDRTIGALNLFCVATTELTPMQLQVAHAMASMATLGILNHRTVRRQELLAEQLQTALNSRVVIEQAKGLFMGQRHCTADEAFQLLVKASSRSNRKLRDIAAELVASTRRR